MADINEAFERMIAEMQRYGAAPAPSKGGSYNNMLRYREAREKILDRFLTAFAEGYRMRKEDAEANPLTIEQLREMDEPVWVACKPIEGGNGYWCLCQRGHIITPAGSIFDVKEIPHWVFYRRPPEGEEDT